MAAKTRTEKMAQTREKLIAAARKSFAEHGYSAASMDDLTAAAGLTRGALYHNFGDKKGLMAAVVDQIDSELSQNARAAGQAAGGGWIGLMAEGASFIRMALEPEVQRIVLLDGPAILGDPSQWPSQGRCLQSTIATLQDLAAAGQIKPVDIETLARLLNGMALNAALWVASSEAPDLTLPKAMAAFECLAAGVLVKAG